MTNTQKIQATFPENKMNTKTNLWLSHALCAALAVFFFETVATFAGENDEVKFHYLPKSGLESSTVLAPPPVLASGEHMADMAQVVAIHRAATSNDLQRAYSEKKFSIFNFTPAIGSFFTSNNLPQTTAFMLRVQDEAEATTDAAKNYWKRPRPYTIDTNLANGKLETSFSYPSGHSTEGTVLALVLADLIPDKKDAILAEGRDLGWHRVWIARHYPTDIHAGRVMARAIVQQMKENSDFRKDFEKARREIASFSR